MDWYSKARGIGKNIYPVRTIGYLFGGIVLFLYRDYLEQLNWLTFVTCAAFLLHPHISFWLYRKQGYDSRQEIRTLIVDTFLVGLFVTHMNFALVPSVAFFTVIFSTAMGVNGLNLFIRCMGSFLVAVAIAVGLTGFTFDSSPPLYIELLSIAYLLFGTISHNYFDFQRSLKFMAAKDQIKKQKIQIEQNLHEKEVLLREIHHRVKNNLQIVHSLLNLQQENISDPTASQAIRASQNRIKIMSLVHQELYKTDDIKDVEVSDYLLQLIDYLTKLNEDTSGPIEITTKIEEVSINLRTAVPLGLIMNEILSNSMEHAFDPGSRDNKIWLHVERAANRIRIEIGDNGKGMENTDAIAKKNSLGLNLVKDLVRQLKGKLKFETIHGMVYHIEFPLNDD